MKTVLLSFDIEEFDLPLEYGRELPLKEQISLSTHGTEIILDALKAHEIKATFFATVVFASGARHIIRRILDEGHELASHGYFHSRFQASHYLESKDALEEISGRRIVGFRMPRMMPTDLQRIIAAGYEYNSSLNPVYLPGRYNNFFEPRTLFETGSLSQLPASAVPVIRFPLFWLSFHNVPMWLYKTACRLTMDTDGYLNIYFHPWEFVDISDSVFGLPKIITRKSGLQMISRFNEWCVWMRRLGYSFSTISSYIRCRKLI